MCILSVVVHIHIMYTHVYFYLHVLLYIVAQVHNLKRQREPETEREREEERGKQRERERETDKKRERERESEREREKEKNTTRMEGSLLYCNFHGSRNTLWVFRLLPGSSSNASMSATCTAQGICMFHSMQPWHVLLQIHVCSTLVRPGSFLIHDLKAE